VLAVVPDPSSDDNDRPAATDSSLIDQIVREVPAGCWPKPLQAEVAAYITAFTSERGDYGHCVVVRNGYHEPRDVLNNAGAVEVTAPRATRQHPVGALRSDTAHDLSA
jgi:hypothetical protein